jgi:simple sugar transport system ATP-binding protein
MLGKAPEPIIVPRVGPGAEFRVRAERLRAPAHGGGGSGLKTATLEVRSGELVGLAAVEGNGQRELLRVLAGVLRPSGGSLDIARPVAFIPEDRTSEALISGFSLTENLVLGQGAEAPWVTGPWLDWAKAARRTAELIDAYGVIGAGPATPAGTLSGGNQQRMIIASALERHPAVVIAENPTRGLDLRATTEVHRRLRDLTTLGVAVLVHLPDLDELMELTGRIVVLARGVLQQMPTGATREEIGRAMLGVLQ